MAKIISLILAYETRGNGTPEDISREVAQLFDFDGALVAEYDPCEKKEGGEWTAKSFFRPENIKNL